MDIDLGNEEFLVRLFRVNEFNGDLEVAIKKFLDWENEADSFNRLRRAFSAPNAEGNRLLWLAFLTFLRPVGFTAVSFAQLFCQLVDQLTVFVELCENDESIWPVLKNVCVALFAYTPKNVAEMALMLRIAAIPIIVDVEALPRFDSAASFAQLSLCLIALKSPSVAILGPAPSASSLPVASRLSDHVQRELKMIGDSPADLRTLVLGKQRQLEVEAAKLSKLSKTSKEEKLWLSSKIMELEEALRNVRGTEQVEQELEVARQDVSKLQEMASESEQKVHRLQREIERERAEAEEMKSALLRRVSEAISEPRSEKPARQFGGTRWVYLPWFMLLFCSVCITGLYVWAYFNGHLFLDEQIPFISSAIDYAPESCVGSMFMSITAIFMFMIIAIRWRLNTDALDAVNLASLTSSRVHHRFNGFGFLAGAAGALCVIGIGSFQEHNIREGHLAFGACFFGFMLLHLLSNTIIDFKVASSYVGLRVFRLLIVIVCACIFCAVVVMYQFSDGSRTVADAKSVLEIADSFFVLLYFMTYSYDFSGVEMLFDVRKLTQKQADKKNKEADDMPLLARLDGDIF